MPSTPTTTTSANATNAAMSTTKTKPKDGKPILTHLPIELRYIIYSEMVKNRTIYMGKVERFSNGQNVTLARNSRNTPRYPITRFHRTKCPLLAIENISPSYVAEIQEWLRGVPWLRFFSWGGYFDPSTTVFVTDGWGIDLYLVMRDPIFRTTAQRVVLDTKNFPRVNGGWEQFLVEAIFGMEGLTALRRFDIRCEKPMSDRRKMMVLRVICGQWRLCWDGCTCVRGGCDERRPVVRWQVPNRRCGRGKWRVLPWLDERFWRWVTYGWTNVTEDEKREVARLRSCGLLGGQIQMDRVEARRQMGLARVKLQVQESKRRLRAWKIRVVRRFFLGEETSDPSSNENEDWQSAEEENARREEERKREEKRLRIEVKVHMRAVTMEKLRGQVRLQMDYIRSQRLKCRWQVGSAR